MEAPGIILNASEAKQQLRVSLCLQQSRQEMVICVEWCGCGNPGVHRTTVAVEVSRDQASQAALPHRVL